MIFFGLIFTRVDRGIYDLVVKNIESCRNLCRDRRYCYQWETLKDSPFCYTYSFVETSTRDDVADNGTFTNRINQIPTIDNYSVSLQLPNSDLLPYFRNGEEFDNFDISNCRDTCTNEPKCIAFSGLSFNSNLCQFFYNFESENVTNVVHFGPSYVYVKNGVSLDLPKTHNENQPVVDDMFTPGSIAGIVVAGLTILLGSCYVFYRRCLMVPKLRRNQNNINLEYDPQHSILLQDKSTTQVDQAELERRYIPNITVIE
eukprot:NODE_13_length_54415_cov_0.522424.p26 type:complete len:258 gc:universal NODE_13_length_54415_cov_0.522424:6819-7592(+)